MRNLNRKEQHTLSTGLRGRGRGGESTGLTRHVGGRARFDYEMRTEAGGLLQGGDDLDALLKYLDQKRGVVVVRTKDALVVARSPGLDS